MENTHSTIDVRPVHSETLSPREFIALTKKSQSLIGRVRIELPRLGSASFGRINVEYNRPRYKALAPFKPIAR